MVDLGVVWSVQVQKWEHNFMLLERYRAREGHCNVPSRHVEEGKKLGRWTENQRQRTDNLDETRRKRLEELGVV